MHQLLRLRAGNRISDDELHKLTLDAFNFLSFVSNFDGARVGDFLIPYVLCVAYTTTSALPEPYPENAKISFEFLIDAPEGNEVPLVHNNDPDGCEYNLEVHAFAAEGPPENPNFVISSIDDLGPYCETSRNTSFEMDVLTTRDLWENAAIKMVDDKFFDEFGGDDEEEEEEKEDDDDDDEDEEEEEEDEEDNSVWVPSWFGY
jgi:hypothetical protein